MAKATVTRAVQKRVVKMVATWPSEAAGIYKTAIEKELHAVTGGDGSLSRGLKLGQATVKITDGNPASVEASGSAVVWRIVDEGTKAHTVWARKGSALRTPQGPRRKANIRRQKGKKVWSKGVKKADKQVKASASKAFNKAVEG